jgi:glutathione S-transferase
MTTALYYGPGACSMGPHIALNEAGADFEPRKVNLAEKAQRTPEYLAINPKGRVPVLQIDGFVLTEAAAILAYIARRFPDARLMPQGGEGEARVLEWLSWFSNTVHPSFAHIRRTERYTDETEAFPGIQKKSEATFWECIATIDRALEGKKYLLGDTFSVADPFAMVFFGWANGLKKHDMAEDFPRYSAFTRTMMARPAVKKTVELEGIAARFAV